VIRLLKWLGLRRSQSTTPQFEQFRPAIETIEGWLPIEQAEWLFEQACAVPDGGRIVEIGSYQGRSTTALAFACLGTLKRVFAIDLWQGMYADVADIPEVHQVFQEGFFGVWERNIRMNNLYPYVIPLAGRSCEIARIWRAPIHMAFVDGSHAFEDVVQDFREFFPHVVRGGLMAFHDVDPAWNGAWRAWHEHIAHHLIRTGSFTTIAYGYKP